MGIGEGGNDPTTHHLNIDDVLAPHAAGADDSVSKFASHGYRLDHWHKFGQGSRQNTLKSFRLPAEVRPLPLLGAWKDDRLTKQRGIYGNHTSAVLTSP